MNFLVASGGDIIVRKERNPAGVSGHPVDHSYSVFTNFLIVTDPSPLIILAK